MRKWENGETKREEQLRKGEALSCQNRLTVSEGANRRGNDIMAKKMRDWGPLWTHGTVS